MRVVDVQAKIEKSTIDPELRAEITLLLTELDDEVTALSESLTERDNP